MRLPQNELPCSRSSGRSQRNLVHVSAAFLLCASFAVGFSSTDWRSSSLPVRLATRKIDSCSTFLLMDQASVLYGTSSDNSRNEKDSMWYRQRNSRESPLGFRRRVRSVFSSLRQSRVLKAATSDDDEEGSWSRGTTKKESPLGVRRRVRSVLEKARNRTGVQNYSEDALKTEQTALDVVAEAASIGGLGAIMTEEGTVDVAIDMLNGDGRKSIRNPYRIESKSKPASTPSLEIKPLTRNPEEDFVVASRSSGSSPSSRSASLVDALKSDVSAAAVPPDPLPFTLPTLSMEQEQQLKNGERVQFQSKMAREGSGYVVVDVKAPPYVVWECLLDFETYPETIPTVRDVRLFTSTHLKSGYRSETPVDLGTGKATRHYGKPSVTRAAFTLSKFRLNIAAIHKYRPHPLGDYMVFTLDPQSTNLVLKSAKGVWHTQADPDGREGYTRVWLLCELSVSRVLPSFIVDYAAKRAMPRATTWLKPQVETAAALWLKDEQPNGSG